MNCFWLRELLSTLPAPSCNARWPWQVMPWSERSPLQQPWQACIAHRSTSPCRTLRPAWRPQQTV